MTQTGKKQIIQFPVRQIKFTLIIMKVKFASLPTGKNIGGAVSHTVAPSSYPFGNDCCSPGGEQSILCTRRLKTQLEMQKYRVFREKR